MRIVPSNNTQVDRYTLYVTDVICNESWDRNGNYIELEKRFTIER